MSKKPNLTELFTFGPELGRGSFATVVLATENTPSEGDTAKKYAMKVIDKERCRGHEDHIVKEITILRKVNHKNVIRLMDCFETKDRLYLQMEYVDGGELFDRIVNLGYYSESNARRIVMEILDALKYLHSQNIVHRDLKPENLLMASKATDAPVKLADFGLSTVMTNDSMLSTSCGTLTYVAPEILKGLKYGKEVDMWSVGVITYILLSGYPPFWAEDEATTMELTLRGKFKFFSPDWDEISQDAKDFITALIQPEPAKRLTAAQALQHPWILAGRSKADQPRGGENNLAKSVGENLVKHFNAKRKLKASIDVVRAVISHLGTGLHIDSS
ncbi:Calcium/calmodulin-dependent protein kinase type 1 [Rhizophlyctis rosea]|uniref:Calcium/calmodulin-dependent protein kinase type 1 n=1 Tax=Rhizophlyctis rosea TaxID=64517 RepID=A0AAD5X238_9FUNG|nr:Calcium/calmodulin-dependent protein kinase type 1 [Rhizophlyctis rosea]